MTFPDAIRDGFSKYGDFNGRSSRSAFWWWTLFSLLVIFAPALIAGSLVSDVGVAGLIWLVAILALWVPTLAVSFRRLHDTGKSGWWLLLLWVLNFIPLVGTIFWIVVMAEESAGQNEWGPPHEDHFVYSEPPPLPSSSD